MNNKDKTLRLVLVLGMMNLSDSELAILDFKEFKNLIQSGKNNLLPPDRKMRELLKYLLIGN